MADIRVRPDAYVWEQSVCGWQTDVLQCDHGNVFGVDLYFHDHNKMITTQCIRFKSPLVKENHMGLRVEQRIT